ncbi:MAG: ATP-binding cassette domain-containing protein [Pyrobaculum sp.]
MSFLRAEKIRKVFPGVVALDNVDFEVERGEVHGLLGENGAGKSTLISILYGVYRPDGGSIYLKGRRVDLKSPQHAAKLGLSLISQHFALVETLTVKENLKIAGVDTREVEKWGEALGIDVPFDKYVGELTVGERQRIEIIKALAKKSELILMDEPTALLGPREVKLLLSALRKISELGVSVVFVTHKIKEAVEVADRITVLRKGKVVGVFQRPYDEGELLQAMFQLVVKKVSRGGSAGRELIYRAVNLKGDKIKHATVEVQRGEFVAVLGVAGNGQEELMELLSGFKKPRSGSIEIDGVDLTGKPFREFLKRGVAYLPEERGRALAKDLSVLDNFKIRCISNCLEILKEAKKQLDIDFPSPHVKAAVMSGGNQQKLLLAREIYLRRPRILIASYPTRGLDVETTEKFYRLVRENVSGGVVATLEDLEEAVERADKIYVISRGSIVGVFKPPYEIDQITEAMTI